MPDFKRLDELIKQNETIAILSSGRTDADSAFPILYLTEEIHARGKRAVPVLDRESNISIDVEKYLEITNSRPHYHDDSILDELHPDAFIFVDGQPNLAYMPDHWNQLVKRENTAVIDHHEDQKGDYLVKIVTQNRGTTSSILHQGIAAGAFKTVPSSALAALGKQAVTIDTNNMRTANKYDREASKYYGELMDETLFFAINNPELSSETLKSMGLGLSRMTTLGDIAEYSFLGLIPRNAFLAIPLTADDLLFRQEHSCNISIVGGIIETEEGYTLTVSTRYRTGTPHSTDAAKIAHIFNGGGRRNMGRGDMPIPYFRKIISDPEFMDAIDFELRMRVLGSVLHKPAKERPRPVMKQRQRDLVDCFTAPEEGLIDRISPHLKHMERDRHGIITCFYHSDKRVTVGKPVIERHLPEIRAAHEYLITEHLTKDVITYSLAETSKGYFVLGLLTGENSLENTSQYFGQHPSDLSYKKKGRHVHVVTIDLSSLFKYRSEFLPRAVFMELQERLPESSHYAMWKSGKTKHG